MTSTPQLPPPTPADPPAANTASGAGFRRTMFIAAGGVIGIIVLLFVLALIAAVIDVDRFGPFIAVVRDLVIIVLALEGILIVLGLVILILQVARLINLIQTELGPLLQNTKETVKTAQGTIEFMSRNVTQPMVRAGGFFAGLSVFLSNWFGIRRAVRRVDEDNRRETAVSD